MKILISDQLEQSCIDILSREGFVVENRPGISPDDLKRIIGGYEALVVRSQTKVTAEVIAAGTSLQVIGRVGTGVDNIDVDAATRRGILVMNTPGGNTVSAAEHTISMMLSLARNIPQARASIVRGEWERKRYTGTEVFEKTLGVIGLGKIGREVASRAMGLGMAVIGYDPVLSADAAARMNIQLVELEEIYRRSDFITVHTPLSSDTKGLLNDATLARCKRGVRIINCARGGIVVESALLRALESGQVAGAALDVFEIEPPKGSPLVQHERVIATPHLGASTEEAQEKVAIQIAHQIADALYGRGFSGVVNSTAMHLTLKPEIRPFVTLADRMGSLLAQIATGKVRKVTIATAGDLVTGAVDLLKSGVLKGVLSQIAPDPVNIVNAPYLAAELGFVVHEHREPAPVNYTNLVRVRYETERESHEVDGTVFGTSAVRLVRMDSFHFEVNPEGHLLVYSNVDRPGMLARVGGILARYQVNIANVSLGRSAAGATALTVMNVDGNIPQEALGEIRSVEGVSGVRVVALA